MGNQQPNYSLLPTPFSEQIESFDLESQGEFKVWHPNSREWVFVCYEYDSSTSILRYGCIVNNLYRDTNFRGFDYFRDLARNMCKTNPRVVKNFVNTRERFYSMGWWER